MNRFTLFVLGSLFTVAAFGCTFQPHVGPRGSGGNTGAGAADGSGGAFEAPDVNIFVPDAPREYFISGNMDPEAGPTADANCQNQPFTVVSPPPDLLIVLDRSGSMNENSAGMMCRGGCGAASKWAQVTTAINQVVAMTETKINWGLKFFGTDNACGVAPGAAVAPGPNNAAAIAEAIAARANQPGSNTPTRAGELSAGEYLATLASTNPKFVLLATDGQPNCAEGGQENTVDDAAAIEAVATVKTMGFPTFVIGIATGALGDTTLNGMAMNGGYPRMGSPQLYYSVTTTADLVTALSAIQTITTGMCTYPLGTPSADADLDKVTVTVDGMASPKDDPHGWRYDPGMTSITFSGTTCEKLMVGQLRNVQVLYGCKVVVR